MTCTNCNKLHFCSECFENADFVEDLPEHGIMNGEKEFEIIRNSESETGYDIPDDVYIGVIPGLHNGWQFEFTKNGKIVYGSCHFYHGTPEECAYCYGKDHAFEMERLNGCEPTGRVIFRGYYLEKYDIYERDYYYEKIPAELHLKHIAGSL